MNNPIKIDTRGNRKRHVRHIGTKVDGRSVRTKCNRTISNYWEAEIDGALVSYFCTDGSRYSYPCRTCLPDDFATQEITQ